MYTYLARVIRDKRTGIVMLQVLQDDEPLEVMDNDEFVTVDIPVDLFTDKR